VSEAPEQGASGLADVARTRQGLRDEDELGDAGLDQARASASIDSGVRELLARNEGWAGRARKRSQPSA
jgi:hypothetical protein